MVGRLQSLKTPLAVLVDKPKSGNTSTEDKEWQVHTIIRKKLVFDIRPEPVFPEDSYMNCIKVQDRLMQE